MSSRQRIIEAAMGLFVRHGYRLTSMELVGQEAGLTRQALYHHFATKESLFHAVVESMKEGAHEAGVAAGLDLERSGAPLAEVLTAQIGAQWSYFFDRAKGSPYVDELLAEHQRLSQDLNQAYAEKEYRLFVETIGRYLENSTELKAGMTPADLARCIQIAARGAKTEMDDQNIFANLERIVSLLVAGALVPSAGDATSNEERSGI